MPAAVAGAVVSALGGAAALGTAATLAITFGVGIATSKLLSAISKPRGAAGALTQTQQLSATIRQAAAARRLIYGTVKAGGVLVYPAQSSDGEYAYMAIYLGEGPMDGLDPVFWIGDEKSNAAKFTGLTQLEFFDGTQTTASATLIAAGGGEWTAADIGHGMAYAVVRYKFDRNAFPNGLILPAFLARGRKVFDPRTNSTAHTSNTALVAMDYVRSEFGYNAPDSEIDWDSFTAAANICDEIIDSIDPANTVNGVAGKVRRYSFNGVIETDVGPAKGLAAIEQTMAGFVRHINGKWRCYAGSWRAPTGPVLIADFLQGPPAYRTHPGRQQRINIARGTYREPKADWQDADYQEQTIPAAVAAEGEIVQNISFGGVVVGATAQRLAKLNMMLARRRVPLVLRCNYAALLWQQLDVVTVNLPLIGLSGDYLIEEYTYAADGGIVLSMVPHVASDYAWTATTDEKLVPEVLKPGSFSRTPKSPTNVTVSGAFVLDPSGYSFPALTVSWRFPEDQQLRGVDLGWRPVGATDWQFAYSHNWDGALSGNFGIHRIEGVIVGQAYDVRVRAARLDDTTSDWVEVANTTVENDTTPPGPPTSLSVTAGVVVGAPNTINWTTPGDFDLLRSRVYASTTNDPATATQIAEIFGLPATAYSTTHPRTATPNFYWVESVDRIGNTSARTYAGTA